ncbi:hypothetical protein PUN28_008382 [Cardiocondyla obscurior]|uniref:CHHC U11-48K-type domain-containing protein n=1 Tax=Cardiocondyla obscurior TaxID=286306 RepID=A0AAW2FZV7_9HYME
MNIDVDEILSCPYNKFHRIPRSKIQRHIVKCERNYPPNFKAICPYDATHRLDKTEIAEHVNMCPTRIVVERSYIKPINFCDVNRSGQDESSVSDFNSYWGSRDEDFD